MRRIACLTLLITVVTALSGVCSADEAQTSQKEEAYMQKNPVLFWELASHDSEASVEFLKNAFEWELTYDEETDIYYMPAGESSDKFYGGLAFTLRKAKLPFLTVYIRVDDIDEKAVLIEELGGHIVIPPEEVVPGSKICLFNEPSGVTFAMIEARKTEE